MNTSNPSSSLPVQLCNTTEPLVRRQTQLPGVCDETILGLDRVLVDTVYGPVVGKKDSETDPRFQERVEWTSFTGIPYALPPVGQYRFRPPHPPLPWQCPLDATHKKNRICPQVLPGSSMHNFHLVPLRSPLAWRMTDCSTAATRTVCT